MFVRWAVAALWSASFCFAGDSSVCTFSGAYIVQLERQASVFLEKKKSHTNTIVSISPFFIYNLTANLPYLPPSTRHLRPLLPRALLHNTRSAQPYPSAVPHSRLLSNHPLLSPSQRRRRAIYSHTQYPRSRDLRSAPDGFYIHLATHSHGLCSA